MEIMTVEMEAMILRTAVVVSIIYTICFKLSFIAPVFCGEGTFFCPDYGTLCANTSAIFDGKVDCLDYRDEPQSCHSKGNYHLNRQHYKTH